MTRFQRKVFREILLDKKCDELINGMCIGSDEDATWIAYDCGVKLFTFYPSTLKNKRSKVIERYMSHYGQYLDTNEGIRVKFMPPKPPLERNKLMVDREDIGYIIGTPKEDHYTVRSGTWHTLNYARKRGKPRTIIPPLPGEDEA